MAIPQLRQTNSIKGLTSLESVELALEEYDALFDEIVGPKLFFDKWEREENGKERRFQFTPHYPLFYSKGDDLSRSYPSAAIAAVANYYENDLLWDANHAGELTHVSQLRDQVDPQGITIRFHYAYEDDRLIDDEYETEIRQSTHISDTTKEQLIRARVGQGVFRTRVRSIEKGCRVTAVKQKQHLRASHIKPWKQSTSCERLDGNNGLMLSPHIDHLFDRGYISFLSNGSLIVSPQIDEDLLKAWNIDPNLTGSNFSREQSKYLKYHNDSVFKIK